MRPSELAALQGFSESYNIDDLADVKMTFFKSIRDVVNDVAPSVATVRLTKCAV